MAAKEAEIRARLKAFKIDIAEYVKMILNGYFYGRHGYSRKIGSGEEFAELAKAFSRDFRENVQFNWALGLELSAFDNLNSNLQVGFSK